MTFETFNLDPRIQSTLREIGFTTPTEIQVQAIPLAMEGKDVLGIAQTGTGKTAAFVLPMIQRFAAEGPRCIRGLVISPTRELALQIHETVETFAKPLGIRSIVAYGGADMKRQVRDLREGVEIVVGCPGRILDHLGEGTMNFRGIEMLVLDEADRMFDMGFLPDLRRILQYLPPNRQNLLFSATMPSDIRSLATQIMRNPVTVQVAANAPTATVTHALFPVAPHLKSALLRRLLDQTSTESVLIFVRTKHRAQRVSHQLEREGFKVTSLQGDLPQRERESAMAGFRTGEFQIMVATDIAARGIDISTISHVINYDIPDTVEAYTHRIGRTGRAARNGDAFSLVSPEDVLIVRTIEKAMGCTLDRRTLPDFNYNAPPQEYLQRPVSEPVAAAPQRQTETSAAEQQSAPQPQRSQESRAQEQRPRESNSQERGARPARSRDQRPREDRYQENREQGHRDQGDRQQQRRHQEPRAQAPRSQERRTQEPRPQQQNAAEQQAQNQGTDKQPPQGQKPQQRRRPRRDVVPSHYTSNS